MAFRARRCIALILLLALLLLPASAFQMTYVEVNVGGEGDAAVHVDYSLTWVEYMGAFLGIANPATELRKALEEYSGTNVTVTAVSAESAGFHVERFARISTEGGKRTYRTPALTLSDAEEKLRSYWFAPLVSPDLSPEMTVIRFPDGYVELFRDEARIPALAHTV
ncbi:MAG: hypothetical protein LUQ64_04525 [Methanomicrobiales archaeon]|nr:hypothetical protein [Methanomicrobiales archaeon]